MDQFDLFLTFTEPLEEAGISYMATGSVASMLYGIPRFTHDLDLVLDVHGKDLNLIEKAFPPDEFYCPPAEVLRIEARRAQRGHFNLIHHETGLKADIYLYGNEELQAWGLQRKKRIDLPTGSGIWVAPPEYVILKKLHYYREGRSEKHLQDIRGMFEVSADLIDMDFIRVSVVKKYLEPEWSALNLKQ